MSKPSTLWSYFLSTKRVWVALLLIAVPMWAVPVASQDAPPPGEEKVKVKPKPKVPKGGGAGAGGAAGPASPTLLLHADMNCTVTIDGANPTKVQRNEPKNITVAPGEHLLKALSDDGRQLQQVVKAAGPGQATVVQINLASLPLSARPEDFDRAAAQVWLAISDLPVSGRYAGAILQKSWGFQDKTLSQAVFGVQQQIKREMDEFKKFIPPDPSRKRIFDELARIATEADKYVDLLTKAIAAAQQANSWMGEPSNMYNQAKAMLDTTLVVPSDIVAELRKSAAFQQALPMDRRNRLGLTNDPQDIQLGADYYQSTPSLLAVVDKGGLAEKMGLKAGDKLISASGTPINSVWDFKVFLRQNAGKKVSVMFERQGKQESRDFNVPSSLPR